MAANLPKMMAVVPTVSGLDTFSKDLNKSVAMVDRAIKSINTKTATQKALTFDTAGTLKNITAATRAFGTFFKTFDARNNPLTGFGRQLEGFSRSIRYIGQDIGRLGMTMTAAFTLPIVAAGVASLKMGSDFDRAMTKVGTLVNQSQDQIAAWRHEILTSMSDLGQLPTELADGLFFAASGFGALANQAPVMEILRHSAQAATIGLGEMGDITKITTALINAYGQENLSASKSVYLLVKAVQEGSFEASELATSLGRALGLFSAYEVPIEDLLGQISALTRIGETPTRAITSLNNMLNNLVKPSAKARDIMEQVGFEFKNVRDIIKEPGGMTDVLEELVTVLPPDYFAQLFGIRGGKAAQAFTTSMRQILAEVSAEFTKPVEDYAEELEKLFIRTTNTISGQAQILKGQLGALAVTVQDAFKDQILEGLRRLNDLIRELKILVSQNPLAVRYFVAIAGAIALIGPALIVFSRITLAIGVITGVAGRLFVVLGSLVGMVINLARSFIVLAVQGIALVVRGFIAMIQLSISAGLWMGKLITQTIAWTVATAARLVAATAQLQLIIAITAIEATFAGVSQLAALAQLALAAATAVTNLSMASFAAIVGGVVTGLITLAALAIGAATGILLIAAAAAKVIGFLRDLWSSMKQGFNDMNQYADDFGEALMIEYSNGIIAGIAHVVRALTYVARVITGWLAPGSPPKILPDIDKWGTETMNEYIKGWGKADFGLFDTIFSQIKGYFEKVLAVGDEEEQGVITSLLLGSKSAVANAISQTKAAGKVVEGVLQNVYDALGVTTPALEGYLSSQLAVVAATTRLERAQAALNATTLRYESLLKPIEDRLSAINAEQAEYERMLEKERLEELLKDPRLTERAEQQILLRMEELELESEQASLQRQRDMALAAAEEAVDLAQEELDAATRQLEYWEGLMGLQEDQLSLMEEMISAIEGGADKVAKAAAGGAAGLEGIGAGGLELPEIELPDPEDFAGGGEFEGLGNIIGDLDKDLEMLGLEFEIMKNAWAATWEAMTGKFNRFYANWYLKWNTFKTFWVQHVQPILNALSREGEKTWATLGDEFGGVFGTAGGALQTFMDTAWESFVAGLDSLPEKITSVSTLINEELLPALGKIVRGETGPGPLDIISQSGADTRQAILEREPAESPTAFIQGLLDSMDEANLEIQAWLDEKLPIFGAAAQGWMEALGEGMQTGGRSIQTSLTTTFQPALDSVRMLWDQFVLGISTSAAAFWLNLTTGFGTFKESLTTIWTDLTEALTVDFTIFKDSVLLIWTDIKKAVEEATTFIKNKFLIIQAKLFLLANTFKTYLARVRVQINLTILRVEAFLKGILAFIEDGILPWDEAVTNVTESLAALWEQFSDGIFESVKRFVQVIKDIASAFWDAAEAALAYVKAQVGGGGGGTDGSPAPDTQHSPAPPLPLDPAPFSRIAAGLFAGETYPGYTPSGAEYSPWMNFPSMTTGRSSVSAPRITNEDRMGDIHVASGGNAAMNGGVIMQFGDVVINNDMDMAVFEQRVRNVVTDSITG